MPSGRRTLLAARCSSKCEIQRRQRRLGRPVHLILTPAPVRSVPSNRRRAHHGPASKTLSRFDPFATLWRKRPVFAHCCRPPRRLRMAAILQAVTSASTRLGLIQISACAGSSRGTSLLAPLALETDGGGGLTSAAWTAVQSQERRDHAGGVTTGQGARCFACSSRSRAVSGRRVSV
jgi:hypothetical protein